MKQKIKCLICNNEYKILSSKHLKAHGLTQLEYKAKFNAEICSELFKKKRGESISEGKTGKSFSPEHVKNMSLCRIGKTQGPRSPAAKQNMTLAQRSIQFGLDRSATAANEWGDIIRERDAFTCQDCGVVDHAPRNMHAHHLFPWEEYPEYRYDLSNGIALCPKCHRKAEEEYRKKRSIQLITDLAVQINYLFDKYSDLTDNPDLVLTGEIESTLKQLSTFLKIDSYLRSFFGEYRVGSGNWRETTITAKEVLEDTWQACYTLAERDTKSDEYNHLQLGIRNFTNFTIKY